MLKFPTSPSYRIGSASALPGKTGNREIAFST